MVLRESDWRYFTQLGTFLSEIDFLNTPLKVSEGGASGIIW